SQAMARASWKVWKMSCIVVMMVVQTGEKVSCSHSKNSWKADWITVQAAVTASRKTSQLVQRSTMAAVIPAMAATTTPAGPVRKVITLDKPVAAAEPVVAAPLKMARADDTVPMAVATG